MSLEELTLEQLFHEIGKRYDAALLIVLANEGMPNEATNRFWSGSTHACIGMADATATHMMLELQNRESDEDWEN